MLGVGLGILAGVAPHAAATPWTGPEPTPTNLEFYLHNSSSPVTVGAVGYLLVMSTVNDTQAPWAGNGSLSVALHYDSVSFVAAPQFAAPLVLNGTVTADVYMNQSGSSLSGGSITLSVSDVAPNGALTFLGTGPTAFTSAIGSGGSIPNVVALTGPTLTQTIPAGDSLEATISINGTSSTHYGIWWGNVAGTTYASVVDFPASTYLTVNNLTVLNANGTPTEVLGQSSTNKTLDISAVVADPLGAYDFASYPVYFTVTNATGGIVYGPVAMNATPALPGPSAPNGTYALVYNYSGLAAGLYNFTVNATDNTEHNTAGQDTLPSYYGRVASESVPITVGLPPVPIYVHVVDNHTVGLAGALVRVFGGANLLAFASTNATGIAGFNLPNDSTFTFKVFWQGVAVGSFAETVTAANETFQLNASVYYPTFELVTAVGSYPIPYALVDVIHPNGSELPLIVASGAGTFTLNQVPAGNYTLTVVYDDSEVVSARALAVTSDGPIVVSVAGVFPLIVTTATSSGGALSGVFVTVDNTTTGATIASGVSGSSGQLSFLVPRGQYNVTGDWSTTFDLTALAQTQSTTVDVTGPTTTTLTFSKAFPPFTSTNEFYLVIGFAALALVIAVLAVLLVRRRKKDVPPPLTPAPPVSPPGSTEETPKSK